MLICRSATYSPGLGLGTYLHDNSHCHVILTVVAAKQRNFTVVRMGRPAQCRCAWSMKLWLIHVKNPKARAAGFYGSSSAAACEKNCSGKISASTMPARRRPSRVVTIVSFQSFSPH